MYIFCDVLVIPSDYQIDFILHDQISLYIELLVSILLIIYYQKNFFFGI